MLFDGNQKPEKKINNQQMKQTNWNLCLGLGVATNKHAQNKIAGHMKRQVVVWLSGYMS